MAGIHAGSSLLLYNPEFIVPHLWFVVTEPEENSGKFVAVMLVTRRSFTDKTVVLNDDDHPFVRHLSSVHYSTANYFYLKHIQRAVQKGRCHIKEDMTDDLLQRVRDGLLDSPRTPHTIRDYCQVRFKPE